ncbi:MAG: site-specific integrase [Deltaproteobacteria bacterium]|jgi:integrase|nr:site-specific integrase [Deltaproteobacteria bacterium]
MAGKSTYKRVHANKWAGVYFYELDYRFNGKPDVCYYICYKKDRRLIWEKVGKISEGYNPDMASELRAERLKSLRHGEKIKTPKERRQHQIDHNKPFGEVAAEYFRVKGPTLKGIVTDRNRHEKHLSEMFDSKRVEEIDAQMIEQLQKKMSDHKPATVWNALELLRRIINFGHKTNRCPALDFQIEMPVKDNDVVEYLTPEESERFLSVVKEWPDIDVRHMVLLAYITGMRRGEIFKLEERDIDFHLKLIYLRGPKGGKSTSIGLSDVAEDFIKNQLEWKSQRFPESPYIFPGRTGGLRKDCSAVDKIKKEACLPLTFRPFHGLRHHFAVTMANSGQFTLDMIATAMTHKSASFTKKKYAQFLPQTLTAISNGAANLLMNGKGLDGLDNALKNSTLDKRG